MIHKETAEHYSWGNGCDGWHLVKRTDVSVIQETMPPGSSEIRHLHRQVWQFFFVLRGKATLEVNQRVSVLKTYHGMEVLPGVPHQIFNKSEQELEILVISKPPSHGDRIAVP
jgi:mannose-6-phosphate isomerase-like protein (cupin superfamily)